MTINNETEIYLSASLRPSNFGVTLYNALFQKYRLNKLYLCKRIGNSEDLAHLIKLLNVQGCSISMPLKTDIISHLDHISETAKITQSVNTVIRDGAALIGHNTDVYGFSSVMRPLNCKSALIYGYGSVVKSALCELKKSSFSYIGITGRDSDKASTFCSENGVSLYSDEAIDLFVNATPISLSRLPDKVVQMLKTHRPTVIDLAVQIKDNSLQQTCAGLDIPYIPGFEMYKHQFSKQFELYTGKKVSTDEIKNIALEAGLV